MSRPALWCCEDCKRPLGQVVSGDLDVFGSSKIKTGHTEVPCSCGAVRVWYATGVPDREKATEFARQRH